jgi:hypothetical protein
MGKTEVSKKCGRGSQMIQAAVLAWPRSWSSLNADWGWQRAGPCTLVHGTWAWRARVPSRDLPDDPARLSSRMRDECDIAVCARDAQGARACRRSCGFLCTDSLSPFAPFISPEPSSLPKPSSLSSLPTSGCPPVSSAQRSALSNKSTKFRPQKEPATVTPHRIFNHYKKNDLT